MHATGTKQSLPALTIYCKRSNSFKLNYSLLFGSFYRENGTTFSKILFIPENFQ